MSILFASITRWKWSSTILACGNALLIPDAYGADGSIATTATPSRNSLLCNDIQASTHAPERPGASPMIPPGWAGSRSTIEVIHGSLRAQLVSLKNQRTLRARVSSMPINGLRSISSSLGTKDYLRVRVGIGRPPGRMDPADYVLEPLRGEKLSRLEETVPTGVQCLVDVLEHGIDAAMQEHNG